MDLARLELSFTDAFTFSDEVFCLVFRSQDPLCVNRNNKPAKAISTEFLKAKIMFIAQHKFS